MKFYCLKENLKRGLSLAERLVGKNLTLPILSNLLISAEKGILKITATDLDLGINVQINAKIEKEGKVTVPAKILTTLINNLPEEKIKIEEKENKLLITTNKYQTQILTTNPQDFPILPKVKSEIEFEIDAFKVQKSFNEVVAASATSETKPELAGVYIKNQKDLIKFVATDSFRLAEKTITKRESKKTDIFSFILPLRTVQELIRILEGKEKLKLIIDKNQSLWLTEGVELFSRLVEGNFPDYEQIIPKTHQTRIQINKDELVKAIRLASIFTSRAYDIKINTDLSKNKIIISAAESEKGSFSSELEVKGEGAEQTLFYNWRYLIDGLEQINNQEVLMELNGESIPTVLKSLTNNNFLYLVMPIKNI